VWRRPRRSIYSPQVDGCGIGSADLVFLSLITSAVGVLCSYVYREYCLARDFRKIWAYSLVAK